MANVLIVDDEPSVRRFMRGCLGEAGYHTTEAANANEALEAVRREAPHCLVLDLGLPDLDGLEVIRRVRASLKFPIVVVSLRDSEEEIVDALDAGADDYLVKPFGVKELLARLRAALRRVDAVPAETVFRSGALVVDLAGREISVNGAPISLTPTEWDLVKAFVQNTGRVLTHTQLLEMVWGPAYAEDLQLLRVNVSNLRRKIEANPRRPVHVLTELAVGYRLRVHDSPV